MSQLSGDEHYGGNENLKVTPSWQSQHDDNYKRQMTLAKILRNRPMHLNKVAQDAGNHRHNMAESESEDLRVRQRNLEKR